MLVPGLRLEERPERSADISLRINGQAPWAREAENLPASVVHESQGCAQTQDPAFSLTSLGEGRFFRLAYSDGTRFLLDTAVTSIWGKRGDSHTIEDLALYLLGPVMGYALRRRGIMALHASTVRLFDHAVALCGDSGFGKSTTAAALALRRVPVLAEDISPVVEVEESLHVEPGYPRVCLWPEAVKALLGAPDALPRLTPTWEKCYLPLDGLSAQFESARRPLGAVYVFAARVEDAHAPRIEELGKREALLELIQNTYMNWLLDREQRAAELDALAKLVENVPVRRIVPHADPARLGDLCDVIIRDAERLLGSQPVAATASGR